MANKLLDLLTKLATGKLVLVFLSLVIVINAFVLPAIYPRFATLDMQFSYSPDKAYQLIGSYGEEGRQYYALIELTLDLVYPILAALFFSSLTIYLLRRIFTPQSFMQKLPLLGVLVMLFDYLENAGIVTMLLSYPRRLDGIAQAANIFTMAKTLLSQFELMLIVTGLLGWLAARLDKRFRRGTVH